MDNKSRTQAHSVSLLFTQDIGVSLIICSGMLNQVQNWILKGSNTPMGPNGPRSKLIYLVGIDYEGKIGFRFTFVYKGVLVIVRIKLLKAKHDATKSNLTILLLSFWGIDIDLRIQSMSLTLYMTWVYQKLHRR